MNVYVTVPNPRGRLLEAEQGREGRWLAEHSQRTDFPGSRPRCHEMERISDSPNLRQNICA